MSDSQPAILTRTIERLWPTAQVEVTRRLSGHARASWLILPSLRRPRMLVPTGNPGAAVMLRRYSGRRWAASARTALEAAVRAGALERLPVQRVVVTGEGVHVYLRGALPAMAAVGVLLGTERANSKPVLQVFDAAGRTIAFVKLDPRPGAQLASNEASALEMLADSAPRGVRVPRLLHRDRWNDLEVLVLSPLAGSQSVSADDDPVLPAVASIAAVSGLFFTTVTTLIQRQRENASLLEHPEQAETVKRALDLLEQSYGDLKLCTGAWHGDWAPWNIRQVGREVQVWDWERFATGVPFGLDAVHHRAQLLWRDGQSPRDCAAVLDAAHAAIQPFSPVPVHPPLPSIIWYLVEITCRYLHDQPAATRTRPRTQWVLDQLQQRIDALEAS